MVCVCTVSLLSFYLKALSACQIVLLYNEELLRSGWFSHKNYNIIHNQGIYQRDVWEAGRGERRSAKEYKQRELEDEQSNMCRNTPGCVEFTGKESKKRDGIRKQGDEGHVNSLRHICALQHVCVERKSTKGRQSSHISIKRLQKSGHQGTRGQRRRMRETEKQFLSLVLHSYKTLLDSWDRGAIIFSSQIKEQSKMGSEAVEIHMNPCRWHVWCYPDIWHVIFPSFYIFFYICLQST